MNEMFPPTENELKLIIKALKEMLENDAFQDQWKELSAELKTRENQLQSLTIENNIL